MVKNISSLMKPELVGSQPDYVVPPVAENNVSGRMVKAMDRVFFRLKGIFPAWKAAFPDNALYDETKKIWLETLIQQGISLQQIKQGLEEAKLSESPFFPSLGQFIAWCKQGDYQALGLPTETALFERVKAFMAFGFEAEDDFEFLNDLDYWLVRGLYAKGKNENWNEVDYRKGIRQALDYWALRLARGEPIPTRRKQLPKTVKVRLKDERFYGDIANLRKMLPPSQPKRRLPSTQLTESQLR